MNTSQQQRDSAGRSIESKDPFCLIDELVMANKSVDLEIICITVLEL